MRPAVPLALAALAALLGLAWGCTTLSGDCSLNLDCPGTPVPMCTGVLYPGDCTTCIEGYCCQELATCYADQECLYGCYEGFFPPDPDCASPPSQAPFEALLACQKQFCNAPCTFADTCNPVTGKGCADDTCDSVYPGYFDCTGDTGTPVKLCGACDNVNSPFCGAELHCLPKTSTCARYCCTDADCGTGRCELDQTIVFGSALPDTKTIVGVCLTQDGSGPACDAPAVAASMGTCAPSFQ